MTADMSFFEIIVRIMQIPGAPLKMGTIIAISMIVGFILFENYNTLIKAALGVGIFVISQEWMTYVIIVDVAGSEHPITPFVAAAIVLVLFVVGATVGTVLGYRARQREMHIERAGKSVITEIENGGLNTVK